MEGPVMNAKPTETKTTEIPKLNDWVPEPEDQIFVLQPGANVISARFEMTGDCDNDEFKSRMMLLDTFAIKQNHYMTRMQDITHVINYFIKFYDDNDEYLTALSSIKRFVDDGMCTAVLKYLTLLLHTMITETMTEKITKMVNDLYEINIENEKSVSYTSTPKLTTDDAKNILVLSYYFRLILPITIHWYNRPDTVGVANAKNYIQTFVCIFSAVTAKIGVDSLNVYVLIKQLIRHRIEKKYNSDAIIHEKKKEKNGATDVSYCKELADEILLVKSLYKIDYSQSVVSYIDGIIRQNYLQYNIENFKFKTVGISAEEAVRDSDDTMSIIEAISNANYRVNGQNHILADANIIVTMRLIRRRFNIDISDEELEFYMNNVQFNMLTDFFLSAFYNNFFGDTNFTKLLTKSDAVYLLVVMKKFLQLNHMSIIPQICTAKSSNRFRDNAIKNRKFNEKFENCALNNEIMNNTYSYISEITGKDDIIKKYISILINSQFVCVDFDPEINGKVYCDLNQDVVIDEFESFVNMSF